MRKFSKGLVLSLVLVGLLVVPVGTARAQTDEVTIESLLAQIESLKAQITELQEKQSQLQTANKELRLNLLRFLQEGATGEDVERLQEYLALDSDIYPEGLITGYFGPLTASAVRKFQRQHGIDQVGVVGPITRGKLHKLFGEGLLPDGDIPPGLTHAPGIEKKGGVCAVPGIAKKLSSCTGVSGDNGGDEDGDEDEGDENGDENGDEEKLEFEGVVASLSDTELVLEDDSIFVINDDTEVGDGIEVGSPVDVKYDVDGDDFVALEIKLDDDSDEDEGEGDEDENEDEEA